MKSSNLNAGTQGVLRRSPRAAPDYDSRIHGYGEPPEITRGGRSEAPEIGPGQWAIDTVLDRLRSWRPCGDGYAALCPGHADQRPSLSIRETEAGHVLLWCHAGCPVDSILDAMGLQLNHLYTSEYARRLGQRRDGRICPRAACSSPASDSEIVYKTFEKLMLDCRVNDDEDFMPLCMATRLDVRTCVEFGLGFNGEAYAIPERDDAHRPVGVTYRSPNGKKWCHPGSARGLIMPVVERGFGGRLIVAEGATDAMALHGVRVRAIGRPAAVPSSRVLGWLSAYIGRHAKDGVVVVGDNDPKTDNGRRLGRDAAKDLAQSLAEALPRTIHVAWGVPQKPYKDVREQVSMGDWAKGLRLQEVRS